MKDINDVAKEVFNFIRRTALEQGVDYVSSDYAESKQEQVGIDEWLAAVEQEFNK